MLTKQSHFKVHALARRGAFNNLTRSADLTFEIILSSRWRVEFINRTLVFARFSAPSLFFYWQSFKQTTNNNELKGALRSFGEDILIPRERSSVTDYFYASSNKINKTEFKGRHTFTQFYFLYVWRTLPPFTFSPENSSFIQLWAKTNIWVCIITSLSFHFFPKTTWCPFNVSEVTPRHKLLFNWQSCIYRMTSLAGKSLERLVSLYAGRDKTSETCSESRRVQVSDLSPLIKLKSVWTLCCNARDWNYFIDFCGNSRHSGWSDGVLSTRGNQWQRLINV